MLKVRAATVDDADIISSLNDEVQTHSGKSGTELNNPKSEPLNEYPYTYRSLAIWIYAVHLDSTSIRSIAHCPERLVEQFGCDYNYMVPLRCSCRIIGNSRCP